PGRGVARAGVPGRIGERLDRQHDLVVQVQVVPGQPGRRPAQHRRGQPRPPVGRQAISGVPKADLRPCAEGRASYGDDGRVTASRVRDFDFHPDEDEVRVFEAGPGGVLRSSGDVYVSAGRYGDVVLWHYAFARHWFKINLTTSLAGQIVETGGDEPCSRFAFN